MQCGNCVSSGKQSTVADNYMQIVVLYRVLLIPLIVINSCAFENSIVNGIIFFISDA